MWRQWLDRADKLASRRWWEMAHDGLIRSAGPRYMFAPVDKSWDQGGRAVWCRSGGPRGFLEAAARTDAPVCLDREGSEPPKAGGGTRQSAMGTPTRAWRYESR